MKKSNILLKLDSNCWHRHPYESVWGEVLESGLVKKTIRILNSPFFSRDVSHLDIVEAVYSIKTGQFEYHKTVKKSGHSTYMLLSKQIDSSFSSFWNRLQLLGCSYESSSLFEGQHGTLFSVDVPFHADIYSAYSILEAGAKSNVWVFQEGHVGHTLRNTHS